MNYIIRMTKGQRFAFEAPNGSGREHFTRQTVNLDPTVSVAFEIGKFTDVIKLRSGATDYRVTDNHETFRRLASFRAKNLIGVEHLNQSSCAYDGDTLAAPAAPSSGHA